MKIEDYFKISKYEIIDGLINTSGSVKLIKQVSKLPFKFGKVGGHFKCFNNQLISLIGAPTSVGGGFNCYNNQLISLIGAPKSVGSYFNCYYNKLNSLEGIPTSIGDCFYCDWSKNLPLLRLLQSKKVELYNDQVNKIINKYCGQKPLKKAILDCQKKLIESGFIGNARW